MKRRILSLLLIAVLMISLAACAGSKTDSTEPSEVAIVEETGTPLYIRASADTDEITATFSSTYSDRTQEAELKQVEDEGDAVVYLCYGDADTFDRVTITADGRDSDLLAFNQYVNGWELSPAREFPFVYGKKVEKPKYERVEFPYEERNKGVLIWTPDDYDPNSADKYSVLYMTDGQNLFAPNATSTGSWAVAESAEAMMAHSDHKLIIVGIENMDGWRDDELTPNLGTPTVDSYADGHGAYFCDFVVDTVMPYIEENYNVYTDRDHTAICGSSSGGIESFYIAMEHPEKFGAVGALSPAFSLYDNAKWKDYLSKKDFSAGSPRIYLYCGMGDDLEKLLVTGFSSMSENLKQISYPLDDNNFRSVLYEKAVHNELYWRIVFPDFLQFFFP